MWLQIILTWNQIFDKKAKIDPLWSGQMQLWTANLFNAAFFTFIIFIAKFCSQLYINQDWFYKWPHFCYILLNNKTLLLTLMFCDWSDFFLFPCCFSCNSCWKFSRSIIFLVVLTSIGNIRVFTSNNFSDMLHFTFEM